LGGIGKATGGVRRKEGPKFLKETWGPRVWPGLRKGPKGFYL